MTIDIVIWIINLGSKDISTSSAALKRRAVKGCKTKKFRVQSGLTEIDCMVKTFSGDIQFMLDIIDTTEKIQWDVLARK